MEELINTLSPIARDYWGAWLMLLFVTVIIFAYHPKNRAKMDEHGNIPLNDDTLPEGKDQ